MQSLLNALKAKYKYWPTGEEFFTCDPDGEVRGSTTVGNDFYPEHAIDKSERSGVYGGLDGAVVTKEIFESN